MQPGKQPIARIGPADAIADWSALVGPVPNGSPVKKLRGPRRNGGGGRAPSATCHAPLNSSIQPLQLAALGAHLTRRPKLDRPLGPLPAVSAVVIASCIRLPLHCFRHQPTAKPGAGEWRRGFLTQRLWQPEGPSAPVTAQLSSNERATGRHGAAGGLLPPPPLPPPARSVACWQQRLLLWIAVEAAAVCLAHTRMECGIHAAGAMRLLPQNRQR